MISRRGFLTALAGLVAAPALLKAAPDAEAYRAAGEALNALPGPTSYTLQKGDVFTIEGVYALNPLTYQATAHLQRFVVTADVSGVSVPIEAIYPRMLQRGEYANVTGKIDGGWAQCGEVPMRLIRPWPNFRPEIVIGGYAGPPLMARVAF